MHQKRKILQIELKQKNPSSKIFNCFKRDHSYITSSHFWDFWTPSPNQVYLVTLRPRQLTQASFLQKDQMLQNIFLISVTLRWHRTLEVLGFWNFFGFFRFFPFFPEEAKVEKICMAICSTHFVPLISILAKKIMDEWNDQL